MPIVNDKRAVRHPGRSGALRVQQDAHVGVVGGGIAGLAAATLLAERGVRVTLFEGTERLGGRVAAWPISDGRTMSRGFHAFFRQYYNLRALLSRTDPGLTRLVGVEDYPLQRPDGVTDSFSNIPRTPPWSILGFVRQSPTFTLRSLTGVNLAEATKLLRVQFPQTFSDYDGVSAAEFLDRLRFPEAARDLALEVFARSFFADPREFSAGELVAMFHTYFMGSAEGLVFDVPDDDYDTALWAPLGRYLADLGVEQRLGEPVTRLALGPDGVRLTVAGEDLDVDAVVLATDPRVARSLIADADADLPADWLGRVAATRNSPPFIVLRLWLDGLVASDRPAFIGTSGFGPLDNVSVLERFEAGAAQWSRDHGGSVVELHAYACDEAVMGDADAAERVADELVAQLHAIFPETRALAEVHRELLVQDDCTLVTPDRWLDRPGVVTPDDRLVLAGDWVRCEWPVALMERAATTGFQAANHLLGRWGVACESLWSPPLTGIARRAT